MMKTTRFFVAALKFIESLFIVGGGKKSKESEGNSSDTISNDYWVDLGLPSGLLWASCNVGATKPEDYGDYFAWGETQPKSTYTDNYKYYRSDGNGSGYTKYCTLSSVGYNGYHDNLVTLQSSDDAAAANVSGSRMPTRAEWEELEDNCTWKWITLNGVNGMCVTGPSGKSLFLPAAGGRWDDETNYVGFEGYYWSSSLYDDTDGAWYLYFRSGSHYMLSSYYYRKFGFSVRPVRYVGGGKNSKESEGTPSDSIPNNIENPPSDTISNDDWVDLGLPSGLLWATRNVGATKPEDYGDYFAWGETQPKSTYAIGNHKYYRRDDNGRGYTKYCPDSDCGYNGYHDNLVTLQSSDDAAAANVSGSRMPTRAEWEELRDNCVWRWIWLNGVSGMCVTGRNDKSLFLPAAGGRRDDEPYYVGNYGLYWSSSLYEDYPLGSWNLSFDSDGHRMFGGYYRMYGFSVRPVR